MTAKDLAELQEASKLTYDHSQASPNAARWNGFVDAAVNTVSVSTVKGTSRLVGIGMLHLGEHLWRQDMKDDSMGSRTVCPMSRRS